MPQDPITTEFTVNVHGSVTINVVYTNMSVSTDAWVDKAVALLDGLKPPIVGVDVEFTPRGRGQKAAVLQLCVAEECLVYHVSCAADEVSSKFRGFITNWLYKFAGFDVRQDRRMLSNAGLYIYNYVDIQQIWKDPDLKKVNKYGEPVSRQGMKDLAGTLIDSSYKEMKGGMTDDDHQLWGKAPLSQKHLDYAAQDAYVSYELYRKLDLYERGRYKVMKMTGKKRCRQW